MARFPGLLRANLLGLLAIAAVAAGLVVLTHDLPQWSAYAVGVYAVFSWVQTLRFRDPPTYQLIWGTPAVRFALVGFGGLGVLCLRLRILGRAVRHQNLPYPQGYCGSLSGPSRSRRLGSLGVVVGGRLSDWWKVRDPPRNPDFCRNILSAVMPAPLCRLDVQFRDVRGLRDA